MPNEKTPQPLSPFSPPIESAATTDDGRELYRRYRALGISGCYLLWGLNGAFAVLAFEAGNLLSIVGAAWAATLACIADSCVMGRYWPRAFHMYTFFGWPLAVPAYLIWSRKKKAAWPIAFHFAATLLVPFVGAIVMNSLLAT